MLRTLVLIGAALLILMGIAHAVHVGRADDVEPYLWGASVILMAQGLLTLAYLRRGTRQ